MKNEKTLESFINKVCLTCGHNVKEHNILENIYTCENCNDTFSYSKEKKRLITYSEIINEDINSIKHE